MRCAYIIITTATAAAVGAATSAGRINAHDLIVIELERTLGSTAILRRRPVNDAI